MWCSGPARSEVRSPRTWLRRVSPSGPCPGVGPLPGPASTGGPREQFTIVAGEAHFTVNSAEHVARAGQTVVIPAGVPHSVQNLGPAQVDGIVERRPALQAKEFHEAVAGLVADGKTTRMGAPKNPLQLGATFWHFRHESRITATPVWVQNLMLPPLWALAKVFGVRAYHRRWDSRTGNQ